jgi:hypothetical protein
LACSMNRKTIRAAYGRQRKAKHPLLHPQYACTLP